MYISTYFPKNMQNQCFQSGVSVMDSVGLQNLTFSSQLDLAQNFTGFGMVFYDLYDRQVLCL